MVKRPFSLYFSSSPRHLFLIFSALFLPLSFFFSLIPLSLPNLIFLSFSFFFLFVLSLSLYLSCTFGHQQNTITSTPIGQTCQPTMFTISQDPQLEEPSRRWATMEERDYHELIAQKRYFWSGSAPLAADGCHHQWVVNRRVEIFEAQLVFVAQLSSFGFGGTQNPRKAVKMCDFLGSLGV